MKNRLRVDKKYIKIIGITLILIVLPITLILVKQTQDLRGTAAEADKLETEGGTLSSTGATKVSDSQASGGQYVSFTNQTPTPTKPPSSSPTPTPPSTSGKYPPNQQGVSYVAVPSMPLPAYLTEVKDPTFAGSITRISNTDGWRNTYAKNPAWNADGSRAAFFGYGNRLLDGNTYQDLGSRGFPGRAIWSNVDPDLIWGSNNGDNRLKKYRVSTGQTTYITFSGYTEVDIGNAEGTISDDDRYVGLIAYPTGGGVRALMYDTVAGSIVINTTLPAEPDNLGISPSGRYMVVHYGPDGSGLAQGNKIYDRLSSSPTTARHLSNVSSHQDFARREDGTELLVIIDGGIKAVRLSDGQATMLLTGANFNNGHISGRAINRWGWVYLSNHVSYGSNTPGYDQLAAVKTDGSSTVQVWAHARTIQPIGTYVYAESTHAVPNRDGTKIMWGGRWNDTGGMYSYVVRVK